MTAGKTLEGSRAEINSLEAGLAAVTELLAQIDLGKAKDRAILKIVRLWGVSDGFKMHHVNKVLDTDDPVYIEAILIRTEGYVQLIAQEVSDEIETHCPKCGHSIEYSDETETESYLNPCSNAGCELNGPVTYHLGCGSQHKDFCANCGHVLFDSADAEIEAARWEEVKYTCSQCKEEGVQLGHFACGVTFRIPQLALIDEGE